MHLRRILAIVAMLGASPGVALERPKGEVVLTVDGLIAERNGPDGAAFDRDMLSRLPRHRFVTATRWTTGPTAFEGVLLRDLAAALGATGQTAFVRAINGFTASIPISDTEIVPVLMAMTMNGEAMRIRDKGPLWIVYDLDDRPDLQTVETESKMIWQVRSITFR